MNDKVLKVIEDLEDTGLETMIEAAETLRYEWYADYEPLPTGTQFGAYLNDENELVISDNINKKTMYIPEEDIKSLLLVVMRCIDIIKAKKEFEENKEQ